MPNYPRKISATGYYHLVLRGNGKQIIFEEEGDYLHFLSLLKQYSGENKVTVCAFCLMENHVHMLAYDPDENISMFMKRLAGNYALWFNRKYGRIGHLFQDRYRSRPVESDDALCTVFRYILNNPREAGICSAAEYRWSSYKAYGNPNSFVDTKVLTELLGSFDEYAAYIDGKYEDDERELHMHARDDVWAQTVLKEVLSIEHGSVIQSYSKESRDNALRQLRGRGLSIRQIERLTGISRGIIQSIK